MATLEQTLSVQQKELVAVGASIGAGCHPCVTHHLQAGAEAGLDAGQLLAAVASAERVTAEAAVRIGDHVRDTLGTHVDPALLSRIEDTLASLGAALAANDKKNIERQLKAASELGASHDQLREAIETAHSVQENAGKIHVREAEQVLDALDAPAPTPTNEGCSCSATDTAASSGARDPADVPTESAGRDSATEPADATSAGCAPAAGKAGPRGFAGMMAAFCPPGGVSAAPMAKCRELFERGPESAAPAPPAEPPAAPDAGSACGGGC